MAPVPQQPAAAESDVGALIGLSEDSVVVGKIKIAADVRTNRIHVITRPVNMPFVRKLIGEFDANVDFAKPVTRPLRYISASDVLPVLVQALTEPGENQQGAETGAGGKSRSAAKPADNIDQFIESLHWQHWRYGQQPECFGGAFDRTGRYDAKSGDRG